MSSPENKEEKHENPEEKNPPSPKEPETDQSSNPNPTPNSSESSSSTSLEEIKKSPFVQDLLVKIKVLKNGVLNERKKIEALTAQVKQMETELNNKENEIRNLCKDKVNLENQLQLEKKKLAKKEESFLQMASAFSKSSSINNTNKFGLSTKKNNNNNSNNNDNSDSNNKNDIEVLSLISNNEKIDKLNEEITKLKFENDTYMKKMNDSMIMNETLRVQFKTLLKVQTDKALNFEQEIKKLKDEKKELLLQIDGKNNLLKKTLDERDYFESLMKELKESKENALVQMQSCLNKCEKLVLENQTFKENLHQHQIDATKLGEKLSEYKNMLIKINTKIQIYHVIKCGVISHSKMDITFGQDKNNNYVMRIDDDDKKIEMVNILDVEFFKQVGKDKVEISYMFESKKKNMTVIVEEIIIDQFMDAYHNFFSEAIKCQKSK